jgi:molybdate transport system substrate-binding protein
MRSRRSAALAVVAAAAVLSGCSQQPAGGDGVSGGITVFAAASLTESFTEIGTLFEETYPGTEITFSFGSSSSLATSINQGAPADVFASASSRTMATVVDAGNALRPDIFAVNAMEVAKSKDSVAVVSSLNDLAAPSVRVAVCVVEAPCGAAAVALFEKNGMSVEPVTREPDVKSVMTKVLLGEVDAGVVYVTDVFAAGGTVIGVPIPDEQNVTTSYPAATVVGSSNAMTARAFVDFLLSAEAQQVLADAGFRAP